MTIDRPTAVQAKHACRIHCQRVRTPVSPTALSEVFSQLPQASVLGGNVAKADADGFSTWAAEPRETFEFRAGQSRPFERLERALARYTLADDSAREPDASPLPPGMFGGGWIGYFGYELGRSIERLPNTTIDDFPLPLIRLCFYDRFLAYDHREDAFWLVALEMPDDSESPREKIAALEHHLHRAERIAVAEPPQTNIEHFDPSAIRCNMTKDHYLAAVARIKRHIHDGDIYQVNFSRRFEMRFPHRPVELFHWQNRWNPSGYAAYLDAGRFHVVSASPEMFITIRDGIIETKPIKGTRPRVGAGDLDAERVNAVNRRELLTSSKEQAELNMIVDLERNDLARICRPGTRRVTQPRTIEPHPTVFHAVATIGGTLRADVTFSDVLKAMFPGGSITGAPKIRAMEIIDDLEPTTRGVYTGAIGFVGIDGSVCLNIAIRTIIMAAHKAFAQTGGGFVADSDPEAEWEETITKAKALLAGIEAVQNSPAPSAGPSSKGNA